jgi:flagellar basal-body rod protein FlgC
MDPIRAASETATSALYAQSLRMRIISENIANAETTGRTAGARPYQRKLISFASAFDDAANASRIRISGVEKDPSPFRVEIEPGHPAANAKGEVLYPNVNLIVEMADMRQAVRAFEANLSVIKQGGEMMSSVIDLLRSGG